MESHNPNIKVIGIWTAWCKIIDRMISEWLEGVGFVGINTDSENLSELSDKKINIWQNLTKGLWAGGNIEIARKAAEESEHEIKEMIQDTDMVFIVCGMWGWTGSGSAPVIANMAKKMWILTIAVVTTPFSWELHDRPLRRFNVEEGLKKIKEAVDTLIVIPIDKIFNVIDKKTTFKQAFSIIDNRLSLSVQWISDLLAKPWDIIIEFTDIKQIMKDTGNWWIWVCYSDWNDRVIKATKWAIEDFWLCNDLHKAKHIILSITAWNDINPAEIREGFSILENIIGEQISYMCCSVYDKSYKDKVKVTIIGTWLEE